MKTLNTALNTALALIVAASFLFSCTAKEENVLEEEGMEVTITATQEGHGDETRTSVVDGGTLVYWEPGDKIKVFLNGVGSRFTSTATKLKGVSTFTGTISAIIGTGEGFTGDSSLWGVYPYREDAISDGKSVTTTLPKNQTGRAGSFAQNTHVTLAKSSTFDLSFYNVCGGVRFSLSQEGVKRVTFQGNNDESIAGTMKLSFKDGVPSVDEVTDGQTIITLTAPAGGTFETGEWYYIEAIPATLSGGFKLTFYKADTYAELSSSSSVSIKRGKYGSLPDVDAGLVFTEYDDPSIGEATPEAVDLGLSVKWASFNLGASAPEDYGDYYAWGEVEPYYTEGHSQDNPCESWRDGKTGYNWESYKWVSSTTLTKYNTDSDYGGTVDNKTVLDPEDDAAHVHLGGSWRMPTDAEWTELRNNCTWTWTTQNGVNGRLVTSNTNGNSIFLPAAVCRNGANLGSVGFSGIYWSSSLYSGYPYNAWYVNFGSDSVYRDKLSRFYGLSVRPVSD